MKKEEKQQLTCEKGVAPFGQASQCMPLQLRFPEARFQEVYKKQRMLGQKKQTGAA